MLLRYFCADNHKRIELELVGYKQVLICPTCKVQITKESALRAVPENYREITNNGMGTYLSALADIGAIDIIWKGCYKPPTIEYPREKDIQ